MAKAVILTAFLLAYSHALPQKTQIFGQNHWQKLNENEMQLSLKRFEKPNTNVAKNLILFIGDGMGVTTTTAARVLKGQRDPNLLGEEQMLSWDNFPHTGFSKTYSTDMTTADSAGTATAYHSGFKTKSGIVGLDDRAQLGVCSSAAGNEVTTVLDKALAEGKSVGIVTTDSLFGASPSGAYAHSVSRNYQDDSLIPEEDRNTCRDIAVQLVEDNPNIQVLLGGGRASMIGNAASDPEYPELKGKRLDQRNLMQEWLGNQTSRGRKAEVVTDRAGFFSSSAVNADYLMGVFEMERMQTETDRLNGTNEPSLTEMTERAVQILSKNPKGFYLFVEGANIDMGHHENHARKALDEAISLDSAVEKALTLTNEEDTMIVVSADHSHAFSFGGYSVRGESILGLAKATHDEYTKDLLNHTYTVLSYGNGPGYHGPREDLTAHMFEKPQLYLGNVPLQYETHGGEDVPIFASGPMAHLFTGTHEQTFIAHAMSYAACLGDDKTHCTNNINEASIIGGTTTLPALLTMLVFTYVC